MRKYFRRIFLGLILTALVVIVSAAPVLASGYQTRAQVVAYAIAQVGKPYSQEINPESPLYRLGPNAYDCSGLCYMAYTSAGVQINNSLLDWVAYPIPTSELMPGDLVYQGYETRSGYQFPTGYHIGMYIGNGEVVHAKGSLYGVVRQPFDPSVWTWCGRIPAYNWPDGDNSCAYAFLSKNISTPDKITAGRVGSAMILLTNKGTMTWNKQGQNRVSVTYHWQAEGGPVFDSVPNPRIELPNDVPLNGSCFVSAPVIAPSMPGNYTLKYNLVHEGVGLFTDFYCRTLDVPVTVTGSTEYGSRSPLSVTASDLAAYPPGDLLRFRPGTLFKSDTSDGVYVSEYLAGIYFRRAFTTGADFTSLGYQWEDIITVAQADVDNYTDGQAVDSSAHPNGALVKTSSSSAVYFLENMQRRSLTYASFVANGFRWDRIFTISTTEMSKFTNGNPYPVRPGTLIKGSSAVVYVADLSGANPIRRAINSANVFTGLGYRWEDILTLPDSELDIYGEGSPVTSVAPRPNGSLIKSNDDSASVYLLEAGKRRRLDAYLYTDSYIATFVSGFDSSELTKIVKGSAIDLPVSLKNSGYASWGAGTSSLSYRWLNVDTGEAAGEGVASAISGDVLPGVSVNLNARVTAPPATGTYVIKWDVYKNGQWLSDSFGSPAAFAVSTARPPYPDGSLIKSASSATVYYIDQGKKRAITSAVVFTSNRLRWDRIHTVSANELNYYSNGSVLQARTGALVKGSAPAVYVIDYSASGQLRRPVASASAFTTLGLRWEDVIQISDAELVEYSPGPDLDSAAAHPNGCLVKTADSDVVYLLEEGRRKTLTYISFLANGFRWDRVITISSSEMNAYGVPNGAAPIPPGTLAKGGGAAVYVAAVEGGEPHKRVFATSSAFFCLGFTFDDLYIMSDSELASYATGAPVE